MREDSDYTEEKGTSEQVCVEFADEAESALANVPGPPFSTKIKLFEIAKFSRFENDTDLIAVLDYMAVLDY